MASLNQQINFLHRGMLSNKCFLKMEMPQEIISGNAARPYIKLEHEVTRGHEKIHMAFTDGHPRDVSHNAIYYTCWNKDHLQKGESFI